METKPFQEEGLRLSTKAEIASFIGSGINGNLFY